MHVMQIRNSQSLPVFKFEADCTADPDSSPPDASTLELINRTGYGSVVPFTLEPYESYQPPLFYLSAALLSAPVASNDALGTLYASRITSALITLATVLIAAFAFRAFTGHPGKAIVAAALLASIPALGFYGGVATNDTMLNLFAAGVTLVSIEALRRADNSLWPYALGLGALTGGAILSKASGAALGLACLVTLLFAALGRMPRENDAGPKRFLRAVREGAFWRLFAPAALVFGIGVAAVAGWWVVRNLSIYGDLLATANQVRYADTCWGPTILSAGLAGLPNYLLSLLILTPHNFIAAFGWGDEGLGRSLYYVVFVPALLLGGIISARTLRRSWNELAHWQQRTILVLGVLSLANFFVFIGFNMTMQYIPAGRHLYMALIAVTGFFALPLYRITNPKVRDATIVAILLVLNLITLLGYLEAGSGFIPSNAARFAR
jgi:hypothetical protein